MNLEEERCNLLIDADDTLWENNIYYEQAVSAFITFLNHTQMTHEEVRAFFDEVERGKGYGTAVFIANLVETYQRLAEKDLLDADLEQVRRIGASIRTHPVEVMAGVEDTLEYLSSRHDLFLLTKGALDEQTHKVERSGIGGYFKQVIVVAEKDVAVYRKVVADLNLDPARTWMIGNSPRSDVNPALAAGLSAVFIPHPHTWRLEHEEVSSSAAGRLLTLARFAELREHF